MTFGANPTTMGDLGSILFVYVLDAWRLHCSPIKKCSLKGKKIVFSLVKSRGHRSLPLHLQLGESFYKVEGNDLITKRTRLFLCSFRVPNIVNLDGWRLVPHCT
jgi:hypothetical protein